MSGPVMVESGSSVHSPRGSGSKLGDTQLIPSQVLAAHIQNQWQAVKDWSPSQRRGQGEAETNDTGARTYGTGDTGFVNLLQTSPSQGKEGPENTVDDEDSSDELVETSQLHPTGTTSPPFLSPLTPALAGHKHDRYGNVLEASARTPAPDLRAAFTMGAARPNFVGLSQVFNQTQADSSPFMLQLRSDPIFERPSPDMRIHQPTSPPPLSSPVRIGRSVSGSSVLNARHTYESMKQSQERRQQRAMVSESPSITSGDEDELGEDSEERRFARRQSRELLRKRAMQDFAGLSAPAANARLQGRRQSRPMVLREDSSGVHTQDAIVISDDLHEEEALDNFALSGDESVGDQYDELSQAVLPSEFVEDTNDKSKQDVLNVELELYQHAVRTIDDPKDSDAPSQRPSRSDYVDSERRIASSPIRQSQKEVTNSHLRLSFPVLYRSHSSKDIYENMDWQNSLGSQFLAIPDSQSLSQLNPPERLVMPSSITSRGFLSESQGFSLSSKTRAELAATPLSDGVGFSHNDMLAVHDPPLHRVGSAECEANLPSSPPLLPTHTHHPEMPISNHHNDGDDAEVTYNPEDRSRNVQFDPKPKAKEEAYSTVFNSHITRFCGAALTDKPSRLTESIPETSPPPVSTLRTSLGDVESANAASLRVSQIPGEAEVEVAISARQSLSETQSNSGKFATAPTHQSPSARASGSRARSSNNSTPRLPRIKKMSDISKDLTPPTSPPQDILDMRILDQDDLDFHNIIAGSSSADSRPTKRPRRSFRHRIEPQRTPAHLTNQDIVHRSPTRSLSPQRASRMEVSTPINPSRIFPEPIEQQQNSIHASVGMALHNEAIDDSATAGQLVTTSHRMSTSLRSSLPPSTPRKRNGTKGLTETTGATGANNRSDNVSSNASVRDPEPNGATKDPSLDHVTTLAVADRVLAKFRGKYMAYYPATCLGAGVNQSAALRVRFDDGSVDEVDMKYILRFDLREGDVVKIDIPGLKSKTWIVRGLKRHDQAYATDLKDFPQTDIHGHDIVSLEAKSRQSTDADVINQHFDLREVPVASIYIPITMTERFKDRFCQQASLNPRGILRETPVEAVSMPTTPGSRNRRTNAHTFNAAVGHEVLNEMLGTKDAIFSNMAFAISYLEKEETVRNRITRLLQENGALILKEGFERLFEVPNPPLISPSKKPRTSETIHHAMLELETGASTLGFTALIADSHSRRAKYMQALALNLPCLSGRWVIDSADHGEALPWDRYLLPAGESSFLNGAVRSRTFTHPQRPSHDPTTSLLRNTLEHRPKMLAGQNVLLVMGESKADEKRKAYLFLTLALGAQCVQRVKGVAAAKALLQQDAGYWNWVYVGDGKFAEAKRELIGLVHVSDERGKKRKRVTGGCGDLVTETKARLIGDEFVVQSLILGALLDDG